MSIRDDRVYYVKQVNTQISSIMIPSSPKRNGSAPTLAIEFHASRLSVDHKISLGGKTIIQTGSIVRGDLRRAGTGHAVAVAIGKYCVIGQGAVVRPPYKTYKGTFSYYPVKIGDYVTIGSGSVVEAAQIGNMVEIGRNCVIGRFAIIKDCSKIEDNSVVVAGTTVPSMAVFSGSPARWTDELPESSPEIIEANWCVFCWGFNSVATYQHKAKKSTTTFKKDDRNSRPQETDKKLIEKVYKKYTCGRQRSRNSD